ncbi:MAG: adenylate/guanylate cyclase domain-containing protein [Rhodospirillales bacterium]|jgi:adenylate cyclase
MSVATADPPPLEPQAVEAEDRRRRLTRAWLRRRLRVSISTILVTGFGSLILLAVASVLGIGLFSAGRSTLQLLVDKADIVSADVEVRVRTLLDAGPAQTAHIADLVFRGEIGIDTPERMSDVMRGALSATPHVTGLMYIEPDGDNVRVGRFRGQIRIGTDQALPPHEVDGLFRTTQDSLGAFWSSPLWSPELSGAILTVRQPVRRDGRLVGIVLAAVSISDLSRFLSRLFVDDGIRAVLLTEPDHVLAHPSLVGSRFRFDQSGDGSPLPRIDHVDDPVLRALALEGEDRGETLRPGLAARMVETAGGNFVVLQRRVAGYGPQAWTLGVILPSAEYTQQLVRLWWTGVAGVAIMLVAVAAALMIGRGLSLRIARFADIADSVRRLDFRRTPRLPDSSVRELSKAGSAFNDMVQALAWFETYLPKGIILQLMRRGGDGVVSQTRSVTVLFSDIRGFTALSDRMGPEQVASLLNEHFALVGGCIEAEGGTLDKFIGDAVMAFWNAPSDQPDHAARALRAARRIAAVIAEDNAQRVAAGAPAVRVSIGVHTGPVVVGNIGTPSRMNYTIVGGAVNVAARIEALAAERQGERECCVYASAETTAAAGPSDDFEAVGLVTLRGVADGCEVWRLCERCDFPN